MKGQTIIIDLLQCKQGRLADTELLLAMMLEVTELIGLTVIEAPRIIPYFMPQAKDNEHEGYTGDVIFAESHLHFHNWLEERKMWIDLTACGTVDADAVRVKLRDMFGAQVSTIWVKERS